MQLLSENFMTGNFRLSADERALVRHQVDKLPHKEKLAVYLCFWEQYSFLRIAYELSVSVADVNWLIESAKKKLRPELISVANSYYGTFLPYHMESVA